ncbi:carbamoyltransferase N-terminal domain-containing protein [Streptomyces virginiae]|uniref:carbamoyltransferase N-terminal domain-containing protein n=1 Tax=Streptomyces virginiae TaxID=1961 RepID=UPI0022577337|nr:carbamoyltransferase N-terminal domain-containing protein [Streptomyces virginiae]MCX4957553.1 nodulation protein U [Streptomyces virginiae]MCX5176295.1 nodulation protein U [Streptomyces virginiae]
MITAGLKLTQSGGIAILDEDRLMFNVEMQKIANGARYSNVDELDDLVGVMDKFGLKVGDVGTWALDGWDGAAGGHVNVLAGGIRTEVLVAPYRETDLVPDPGMPGHRGRITIGGQALDYDSYVHVAGHLASAYCTSPFARRGEPSMVLVWDGGCFPRLYCVDADGRIEAGGEAFPLIGHTYSMTSQYWGPFKRQNKSRNVDDLSVAGKMMAYIALGTPRERIKQVFREEFFEFFDADSPRVREYRRAIIGCGSTGEPSHAYVHQFLSAVQARTAALGFSDEDVLASVHSFLEELLIDRVTKKIQAWKGGGAWNLCFAGGCALNIKWNSALRSHPTIKAMWVPPFPDDSGVAIGTACLAAAGGSGLRPIQWGARLGPDLEPTPDLPRGWSTSPCTPEELAQILHTTGQPAVVLDGRAELGPRALGGRSIIAAAVETSMKRLLNDVKSREHYRPVAPICLEEHAPTVFDPGTPDPYMLFEHWVRPEWIDRVPAVMHLDGTARLQTVNASDDPNLHAILREYYKCSGIPVLCNTSANYNGRSFFPDVASAIEWGQLDLVWSEGVLYRREDSSF